MSNQLTYYQMTKKGKAYIVKASGETVEVEPRNGTDFQLEELQEAVGGYIEIVQLGSRDTTHLREQIQGGHVEVTSRGRKSVMVVNEEGKIKQLPVNLLATRIFNSIHGFTNPDVIAGDALICDSFMVK